MNKFKPGDLVRCKESIIHNPLEPLKVLQEITLEEDDGRILPGYICCSLEDENNKYMCEESNMMLVD